MKRGITLLYQLICSDLTVDEITLPSYGISCGEFQVPHISLDQGKLTALIDKCNQLGLHVLHLMDVIEDFLAE
ncbi:MAG: hypothetical protein HFE85_05620 [Clostridiales bacterium]|nr:hypothetical protein [Clostridiales bacterium]